MKNKDKRFGGFNGIRTMTNNLWSEVSDEDLVAAFIRYENYWVEGDGYIERQMTDIQKELNVRGFRRVGSTQNWVRN